MNFLAKIFNSTPKSKLLGERVKNYTKLTRPEKINIGHKIANGSIGKANLSKITIENRESDFVKKTSHYNNFTPEEIARQVKIHRKLKVAGVKTFNTFLTDGKSFYSENLNTNGIIAISSNNESPTELPIKKEQAEKFSKKITINNLENFLDNIINQCLLSSKAGVILKYDCPLFLVPNKSKQDQNVDIDFIVGDFDILRDDSNFINKTAGESLKELKRSLTLFIEKFVEKERIDEYQEIVKKKLSPSLKEDEIFTKNGIKKISEYDQESDGEVLKSRITTNEKTSWEEIEKLSKIPGLLANLTNAKKEHKDKIVRWEGSIEDKSCQETYLNLESVGRSLDVGNGKGLRKLKEIGLHFKVTSDPFINKSLKRIGGKLCFHHDFNAESLEYIGDNVEAFGDSFIANSLKKVGGWIFGKYLFDISVNNLKSVWIIYLRNKAFHFPANRITDFRSKWGLLPQKSNFSIPKELQKEICWIPPGEMFILSETTDII